MFLPPPSLLTLFGFLASNCRFVGKERTAGKVRVSSLIAGPDLPSGFSQLITAYYKVAGEHTIKLAFDEFDVYAKTVSSTLPYDV